MHSPLELPTLRAALEEWFSTEYLVNGNDTQKWQESLERFVFDEMKFEILDKTKGSAPTGRQILSHFMSKTYPTDPDRKQRWGMVQDARTMFQYIFKKSLGK